MTKNLIIITGWFLGCLLTFSVSFTTLNFLRQTQVLSYSGPQNQTITPPRMLAFLERPQVNGISTSIDTADARPVLISEFLETNGSPLKPYDYWGQFLTNLADKYRLDYRLLPSIAMQESNLCKKIPADTYNCLGLGIHARGTWGFPSFEANFEKAAEILRKKYADQGLITPDEIQDKYTPQSNGSWEFAVNHFMDQLETADW